MNKTKLKNTDKHQLSSPLKTLNMKLGNLGDLSMITETCPVPQLLIQPFLWAAPEPKAHRPSG